MDLKEQLSRFVPVNEQEQRDKEQIQRWLDSGTDIYTRQNNTAHLTASSWVVSPDRKQVLMVYHNLFHSWSWMGGHADGERNLSAVALREAKEESGLTELKPLSDEILSLEILTVDGHVKRGSYVSSHLHLNVTYLFQANPADPLRIKPDENAGVCWFPVEELPQRVTEPWMQSRIYEKITKKVKDLGL